MSEGFKSLRVYQMAYDGAMEIFSVSKLFPKEETYALTDQVRRSSRSVCACIAEAYRKRLYPKHFVSKLTDADGECAETMVHLSLQVWFPWAITPVYLYATMRLAECLAA
ncbi:MAG: four helix bundle protein [Bacteroidetes bacterium]|nr:four helix bundle protein [Bacteroidota bacterium]